MRLTALPRTIVAMGLGLDRFRDRLRRPSRPMGGGPARPIVRLATVAALAGLAGAGALAGILLAAGSLFAGAKIGGVGDLVASIAARHPGDRVALTAKRGSKRITIEVVLAKQPLEASS